MYMIIRFALPKNDGVIKISLTNKEFFKGVNWIMMPMLNNKAEILKFLFFRIMAQ